MSILKSISVYKRFTSGNETITILNNIDFELHEGESEIQFKSQHIQ